MKTNTFVLLIPHRNNHYNDDSMVYRRGRILWTKPCRIVLRNLAWLIAPISLIISFFKPSIRIYEVIIQGSGMTGFYIAIISGFWRNITDTKEIVEIR